MKDITGQKFGRLTAIKPTERRNKSGGILWNCKCDCGTETETDIKSLTTKNTKSCGCLLRETRIKNGKMRKIDITGNRYGRLVAIKPTGKKNKWHNIIWECQCDCGRKTFVSTSSIGKKTNSCGCLSKQRTSESRRKDITGKRFGRLIAIVPTSIRLNGHIAWECKCDCGAMTLVATDCLGSGFSTSCGCYADAVKFSKGSNIDPMLVPKELVDANKLRIKIKKELKKTG